MVTERFPKRMSRKIALQAGFAAPGFNEAAGVRDFYGGISVLSAEQGSFFISGPRQYGWVNLEPALEGDVNGLIYGSQPVFPAFLLLDAEGVPGLETLHLTDGQPEQVSYAQVGVDSDCEECEVAWLAGEVGSDSRDVFKVPDRVDDYAGTGFWVIEVLVLLHWGLLFE